jgi:hypothetical protein
MAASSIRIRHHAVKFYGNESSLYTTVAGFLSEGLVAGQPAIIIATETHRRAIVEELAARLIDVKQAQRLGVLVLADARQTLESFMVDGEPDADGFERVSSGLIEGVLANRPGAVIRAYGEMVDLLWKDGRADAAIRLEMWWNKLATKYGFSLLCGYSMGNFYKQAERFQAVCQEHTHVFDPDTNLVMFDPRRAVR